VISLYSVFDTHYIPKYFKSYFIRLQAQEGKNKAGEKRARWTDTDPGDNQSENRWWVH